MLLIFMQIDPSKQLSFLFWQIVSLWQAEHVYKFEEYKVAKKDTPWTIYDVMLAKQVQVDYDRCPRYLDNWF
jgi:hypothetical protein